MLKIRLTRKGKRNRAFFRIVVAESQTPVKGRFIEILGFVDPLHKKHRLKKERIAYWLSQGAKPSATVHNLLVRKGIIQAPKINKFAPRKKKKRETEASPPAKPEGKPPKKKKEPEVKVKPLTEKKE